MGNCINKDCGGIIDENARFCFMCGSEQFKEEQLKEKKKKKGFAGMFSKQVEPPVVESKEINPEDLEDFRRARPQIIKPAVKKEDNEQDETLKRIEEKLDMVLKNYSWLFACVYNWVEGHKSKKEKEETEED